MLFFSMINPLDSCSSPISFQQMDSFEENVKKAIANPKNQGEMADSDAVGTVGSPDCGDMLRMWLKFKEEDGKKVIDRASFQSFGCQTAIAVASMTTELLKGKTLDEAKQLKAEELAGDLGELPPMKIHCGQLVEGALQNALGSDTVANSGEGESNSQPSSDTLSQSMHTAQPSGGKIKIVKLDE